MWRALLLVLIAGCSPPACSDAEERELMADVRVVAEDDGPLADAASRRLIKAGHRALEPLETGLYFFSGEAKGRRRIVKTIAAIRDPDAAPLLAHLARHDPDPDVRAAAEAALTPPR